jgi:hypothetical protein
MYSSWSVSGSWDINVQTTIDSAAIEIGLTEGMYAKWCAANCDGFPRAYLD